MNAVTQPALPQLPDVPPERPSWIDGYRVSPVAALASRVARVWDKAFDHSFWAFVSVAVIAAVVLAPMVMIPVFAILIPALAVRTMQNLRYREIRREYIEYPSDCDGLSPAEIEAWIHAAKRVFRPEDIVRRPNAYRPNVPELRHVFGDDVRDQIFETARTIGKTCARACETGSGFDVSRFEHFLAVLIESPFPDFPEFDVALSEFIESCAVQILASPKEWKKFGDLLIAYDRARIRLPMFVHAAVDHDCSSHIDFSDEAWMLSVEDRIDFLFFVTERYRALRPIVAKAFLEIAASISEHSEYWSMQDLEETSKTTRIIRRCRKHWGDNEWLQLFHSMRPEGREFTTYFAPFLHLTDDGDSVVKNVLASGGHDDEYWAPYEVRQIVEKLCTSCEVSSEES